MSNNFFTRTYQLPLVGIVAILVMLSTVPLYARPAARSISVIASTVPANGDVNPCGIFRVPVTQGHLTEGNLLISNFNNSANLQGTGTTIVQISPKGDFSLFAQIDAASLPGPCPGGVGLTTALVVLKTGWVIVGSLPTVDGTSNTAQAGCLIVLDSNGNVVSTIADTRINGPWDMTVSDNTDTNSQAALFVTNVLNGTVAANGNVVNQGTVIRVGVMATQNAAPTVQAITVIGSRFSERTDPGALVIGPTGVALSADQRTLYVADSLNNRVAAISDPLTRSSSALVGTTVTQGGSLNDPLGITLSATGQILTANGDDGFLVQTTPQGQQTAQFLLDSSGNPPGAGALFGVVNVNGEGLYYVDDASNTLNVLQ
jgi:SMP-30/Gluconolactonase/LRE-like region